MADGSIKRRLFLSHAAALEFGCEIESVSGLIQDGAKSVELPNGLGMLSFGASREHLLLQICTSVSSTKEEAEIFLVVLEPCHCPDKPLSGFQIT
jgi:hypothetical protein